MSSLNENYFILFLSDWKKLRSNLIKALIPAVKIRLLVKKTLLKEPRGQDIITKYNFKSSF